ncbi:MAG: glycosyltransferase family 4 protein [Bacteroidales bacterium]
MKIAHITAGAGHMYCGSCLRDTTLGAALRTAGHDLALLPVYTPTRTEEHEPDPPRVFLGGINVFLQEHFALFRKIPKRFDRVLDNAALLRLVTRRGVSVEPAHLGHMTVSMLQGLDGPVRKEIEELVTFLAGEVRPEIVTLPNSLLISLAPAIKAALNVPICCTLQGEDVFLDGLREPYRGEALALIRRHAESVDRFIAVSEFGAGEMARCLGLDRERITVVPLGIQFDGHEPNAGTAEPFTIGYLARVSPEKGLDVLCEAYRRLRSRGALPPSRVVAAGYLMPEGRRLLAEVRKAMASAGLANEFTYVGEVDRQSKLAFLRSLSVFSLPAAKDDQKGLSVLEAMASGVPVVQPRRGAFIEIVEKTGGGVLVRPDDPDSLADAILDLWQNPERRRALGEAAYAGVRAHYGADVMLQTTLGVYESLLSSGA